MKYVAAMALAMLGAGCADHLCNDIGFPQGLQFRIDNGPAPADYQMQVEHDGGLLVVDYSVMADAHVRCAENCSDLDDTLRIGPMEAAAHFMSDGVRLGIVGTPDWQDLPAEVHIKILRNAVVVHDQVYAPTYEHSEPWGEGCGEGIQASYVVTLPQDAP